MVMKIQTLLAWTLVVVQNGCFAVFGFQQWSAITSTSSFRASFSSHSRPLQIRSNNRYHFFDSPTFLQASSSTPAISTNLTSPIDDDNDNNGNEKLNSKTNKPSFPVLLWRFTRPHTLIGSALAIPALHVLAAPTYQAAFSLSTLGSMVYAMIPALLMNLYITGLNQITDVEIDKINKPNLPIAAGHLSLKQGIVTVTVALLLSLIMGVAHPVWSTPGLNMALWFSGILGTMYSLPPVRLKRFPFLAAFCIVAVRGAVINAGFFAHAKVAAFGGAAAVAAATATGSVGNGVWACLTSDSRCALSSLYFAVFGVVIALMKDVPDVKGDAISNVRTFSVRLGQKRVFQLMHRLLTTLFVGAGCSFFRGAMLTGGDVTLRIGRGIVGIAALLAGYSVQREAVPVDPENPKEVYTYYMHLWKLFYLSYLVLPLAR